MQQESTPAPVRGALFYTTKWLLAGLVGAAIQRSLGPFGSTANQILFSLLLAIGFAVYSGDLPLRDVFRLKPLSAGGVVKSLALGVSALALMQVLGALAVLLVERTGGQMPQYYNLTGMPFAVALVVLGILPPICEEIAYRGYLQHTLGPLGPRAGLVVTALLFGAVHGSLIRLLPLSLLGLIFGVAVQRTGSLYSAMIIHLVNNAAVLGLTYYGAGIPSPATLGVPILLGAGLVLGLLVWALLRSLGETHVSAPPVPRLVVPGMVAVLVPALLIYAYTVASEIATVFGSR